VTHNRRAKAILGKAVVNGEVAHAAKIQGERILNVFNLGSLLSKEALGNRTRIEVAEFSAEVYLFLLAANQLTRLLGNNKVPKKQYLTDKEIKDIKHLRNIWEHRHPATTKLFTKWDPEIRGQQNWLKETFPENKGAVYEIHSDSFDTRVAGIVSVRRVIQEAEFWIGVSKDFNDPKYLWFPREKESED
jgi:hypothetical protein